MKKTLLSYVRVGWSMGKRQVDSSIVGWNRPILLQGPPGTGKTSLSRALAHKAAVHLDAHDAVLVEVCMEKMLSKWFSESSARVRAVFDRVAKLAESRMFVVVFLDEVETVGLSRKRQTDGIDPGEDIRVTNALLGGIDSIRI